MNSDENLPDDRMLYRIQEVAHLTGTSVAKIYLMMQQGELPYTTFAGRRGITRGTLKKLLGE